MVQLHWPTIRRHSSQNALKHLASLEADFQALDASVKLNVSKQNKLPSSFQKDISKGIFQALTDHDYPYEISEADRTLIGGLLLKHITVEAVDRARDRIPLRQYRGLHKSFQTLATKFKAKGNQSHLNQMTKKDERGAKSLIEPSPELGTMHARRVSLSRQAKVVRPAAPSNSDDTHERAGQAHSSRGRGRDATKAAIAIDRPKKKGRRKKKRDEVTQAKGEDQTSVMGDDGGILETMDNRHRVQEVDVHETFIDSGVETNDHEDLIRMFKDIEAQCEQISLQLQDLESGQLEDSTTTHVADELIEGEDVRKINLAEEDDAGVEHLEGGKLVKHPSDATQGPSGQADNRKRLERNELFLQDWEVKEELEDPDASSLITFNIEHQAAVNQLDDMDSNGILRKLSSSLETMRSLVHDVPHFIRFTNAMLLDNGNLEVHAHAESKDDIERLSRVRGWDYEFEKSISTPIRTYAVETSRISLDSFNWQTSKKPQRLENSWRKIYTSRFLRSVSMIFETFVGARSTRRKMVSSLSFVRLSKPTRSSIVVYSFTASATHVSPLVKNFATAEDVKPMVTMRKTVYLRAGAGSVDRSILRRHAPMCRARKAHKQNFRYTDHSSPVTKQVHEAPASKTQSRTAARNPSSLNSVPVVSHNEVNIKVEEDEPLQSVGPVSEHHLVRAAASNHTVKPANARHEPYVKAEGIGITQEMSLAQNQPSDFMMMQRQLDDLRKLVVERLSVPQHPLSQRGKRGADDMVIGGPSSYPRKQPRRTTQRPAYYPGGRGRVSLTWRH